MAQIKYIKDLFENEEASLREISRITGHSFGTVRKYAYQENWSEDNLPDIEPQSYPVLRDYIPIIDKWLEEDRKAPRKQRHTVIRIYHRLRDEQGFTGCYSTVKKYVRKKKFVMKTLSAGYLPLDHPKGWGQVDFGLAEAEWAATGERFPFYALTISFPGSNHGVTQAFPSQNQECLLEGMKRIFERIGGVPPRLRFDNMTTAVAQVLKDGERVLTDGFTRFMLHYRFQADFCNPASGNEKGNVENKVGYNRRNAFVPVPVIASFDEFNERLWEWCEKDADRLHYKYKVPAVVEPGAGRDLRPGDIRPGPGRAGTVNTCPAKGSDNARVWDTSKRAIQIVLNNLKGIFFRDDDLEQMTFSGTGRRGGNRYHDPPHLSFSRSRRLRLGTSLSASDFAIHKDSVIDFYMLPCYNNIILAGPWDMGPWGHQERSLRS